MGGYITESGQKVQVDEYIELLENRLQAIECLLGLLPSHSHEREGASVWLAFQMAAGANEDVLDDTMDRLEKVDPGYLRRVEDFARDMKGRDVAALLYPKMRQD